MGGSKQRSVLAGDDGIVYVRRIANMAAAPCSQPCAKKITAGIHAAIKIRRFMLAADKLFAIAGNAKQAVMSGRDRASRLTLSQLIARWISRDLKQY
jgi:hypothetical protein